MPGKGGVRIENIVIIRQDDAQPDTVTFENIVTVGYDWDLIDLDLLDDDERAYLRDYERLCVERGTQVTASAAVGTAARAGQFSRRAPHERRDPLGEPRVRARGRVQRVPEHEARRVAAIRTWRLRAQVGERRRFRDVEA